ncbi:hypothetical protein [Proteus mirabilis]|uniref:hypothetical protein n=1 Tax=Proteus mirabilis TaxID=584 RepID=UPI0034E44AE8
MRKKLFKFVYVLFLFFSASVYADRAHYIKMEITNDSGEDLINVYHNNWYKVDAGTDGSKPIRNDTVGVIKSKGKIGAGPGFGYVYKIHNGLYLDVFMSLYQNNAMNYEFCFSSVARKFINGDKGFGDVEKRLSCRKYYLQTDRNDRDFDIKYGAYSFSGYVNVETVGVFGLYDGYFAHAKLKGPNCLKKTKSRLGASIYGYSGIQLEDGYYAMFEGCPFFSYCPKDSKGCITNSVGYYQGDFYALPFSDETLSLFKDKNDALVYLPGKTIDYNKKPVNRSFVQQKMTSIRKDMIVSGRKLYEYALEVNKQYCQYSKNISADIICGEPKYSLQKRVSGQLRYLPTNELEHYDCFVDSIDYPNIGSNICYLKNVNYK